MGEQDIQVFDSSSRVAVDTFAGRIHIEWDHNAAVTPMGQLPFFIEFLKASGLYDSFLADCPLCYTSTVHVSRSDGTLWPELTDLSVETLTDLALYF